MHLHNTWSHSFQVHYATPVRLSFLSEKEKEKENSKSNLCYPYTPRG